MATIRRWHGATPAQRGRWSRRLARWQDGDDESDVYEALRGVDPTDGPALYVSAYAARLEIDAMWVLVAVETGQTGPTSERPDLLESYDCALARRERCVAVPWEHRGSRVLREAWARM